MSKTYFVTGGCGFIGSALVRHLMAQPDVQVINIDVLTYAGNPSSLNSIAENNRYHFHQTDICKTQELADLFALYQPDGIFHLAAESHVDRSIDGAQIFMQTNLMGTFSMLEAARHYYAGLNGSKKDGFRFLHVSTDEVYGTLGEEGLFSETTPYDPRSPYSASKAGSDFLASAWYHTYDFPIVISNCSNNYGPFHFPEKLIPKIILRARAGESLTIYGDGKNVRDWLYVDDHAKALQLILEKGRLGEKYNVGGRNERTNLQIVERICSYLDEVEPKSSGQYFDQVAYVADRPGHDRRYAIDATKLEDELGWRADETFETGIIKTIDWYRDNKTWWEPLQDAAFERLGKA